MPNPRPPSRRGDIHIPSDLLSHEIDKQAKKSGAKVTVRTWEVHAIRIAKLDRAIQEDPSTAIFANYPAV